MNPPNTPREELEVRLTALLLDELAAVEAAALHELIAKDTQLAELHERLKRAVELVREATATAAEPAPAPAAPLKLSDERRQKLLAHFKTIAPREFVPPQRRREWSWMVRLSAAAAAITLLAAIAIPNFVRARENGSVNYVLNNLRILEGAKDQWALENNKSGDDVVTLGDLKDYLRGGTVKSVLGEQYKVGRVSDPVTAQVDASRAKKTFGGLATKQPSERFLLSGQPAPGQWARLNADGELTFVDKNAQATPAAPSRRDSSVTLAYSSAPSQQEKLVRGKPLAASASRLSPDQVFQKSVAAKSMPATDGKKPEVESLELRRAGRTQEIVLPSSSTPDGSVQLQIESSTFQSNRGGSEFPLGSLLATTDGRGGVFGGGGGGGIGGGGGFGPVADAQTDPNARNARRTSEFFGNNEWSGVLRAPAPSSGGSTNQFVGRYAFAVQPPGINGSVTALGLQPAEPNQPPVNVGTKFFESSQTDNLALGFRYDRELERGGRMGVQNGAAPSPASQPSKAKPDTDEDISAGDDLASIVMPPGRTLQEKNTEAGLAGAPRTVTTTTSPERALELNRVNESDPRARKRDGIEDLYAGQLPRLGDSPELGRLYRANPDATAAAGEARSTVERPATPQPAGKDLAKLRADRAGAVVAHDVELNGRLEQRVKRLGETAIPLGVDAARQLDAAGKPMNRDAGSSSLQAPLYYKLMTERYGIVPPGATPPSQSTERGETTATATPPSVKTTPPSEEAIGRKSASIVLPSVTTDTIAGAPIVSTGSLIAQNEPTQTEASNSQRPVQAPTRQPELMMGRPSAQSESLNQPVEDAKKQEPEAITKNRAYFEVKRQVENLQRLRDNTILRLEQERIDATLAKKGAVEIVDPAAAFATVQTLKRELAEQDSQIAQASEQLGQLQQEMKISDLEAGVSTRSAAPAPIPQPEVQTRDNAYSTFALNVSDVSFKLAVASLEKGVMPEPATIRSEEFINAFDYRDPEPPPGVPIAFAWERTRYPFAHNRDLLRFSVKTAAAGRQSGRPLNLVLLLDNSGSMERADRVKIIHEALRVLATQLQPQDQLSVVTFARTARLWVDGVAGNEAAAVAEQISTLIPQGGTNLGDAMDLAYQTALRHYLANGVNRVVLLTDGAANLGNVDPDALKQKVEAQRKQGIALDCFGIGWEGYNDDLLEILSRNGDGRYGFINTPEEAASDFAGQLAGALRVAASDVKVQVEFNPGRVTAYRQIGYAKHQLTKEQFRDNTVDAAEIGAAESGNALYVAEVNARGEGPLAIVRVRYKVPGTADYREHEWAVPYTGNAVSLEQAGPVMRLAATASAFSEWLVSSPYAAEVTPDRLLGYLSGVPETYGADARPKKLEWMIRQAGSIAGK